MRSAQILVTCSLRSRLSCIEFYSFMIGDQRAKHIVGVGILLKTFHVGCQMNLLFSKRVEKENLNLQISIEDAVAAHYTGNEPNSFSTTAVSVSSPGKPLGKGSEDEHTNQHLQVDLLLLFMCFTLSFLIFNTKLIVTSQTFL